MRVHVTGLFWIYLICVLIWREVAKRNVVQAKLHSLGPLALVLQWYSLFFIGYAFTLCYGIYEMLFYLAISEADIHHNLNRRWAEEYQGFNTTDPGFMNVDQFRLTLEIRTWLRVFSWIAVICGPIVFCLILGQTLKFARMCNLRPVEEHAIEAGKFTFGVWKVPLRMNMVMLILVNPGVFSVMSLRALCRVWALCTGTTHNNTHMDWPEEQTFESAVFMGDMELAAAFQYFAVHVFARLCGDYLCDSSIIKDYRKYVKVENQKEFQSNELEYRRMVRWAAFLVVHAFCVVGAGRCLIDFVICEGRIMTSYGENLEKVQTTISSKLDVVFLCLTILCVINMKLICDMKDITKKLAKASLMFMGTRVLLLLADNQALVVEAFTVDSKMYANFMAYKAKSGVELPDWNFYQNQAYLFHLSLVGLECLFSVAVNMFAWKNLNVEQSEIMSQLPERTMYELEDKQEALEEATDEATSQTALLGTEKKSAE